MTDSLINYLCYTQTR